MMRSMRFSTRLDDAQCRVSDIRSCVLARPRDTESNRNRRATHPDRAGQRARKVMDVGGFRARKVLALCLESRAASTSVGGTFVTAPAKFVRSGPCQNGAFARRFLPDLAQSGRGLAWINGFRTDCGPCTAQRNDNCELEIVRVSRGRSDAPCDART